MLELTSFVCGAAVMVLEMAGARLLAPHLGTSIVVWTALIGVILASLSLGYWLGGRLADRNPNRRTLAAIILAAAGYVLAASLLHQEFLASLAGAMLPLEAGAILAALLLFAVPSVLLGMVSPYIIQVRLADFSGDERRRITGTIMGRFFALSTVGSILGTFLGGYVLISWLGTRTILYSVSAALALAAFICLSGKRRAVPLAVFLLSLALGVALRPGPPDLGRGFSVDTRYNHLHIQEGRTASGLMRLMRTDPGAAQSGMLVEHPNTLALAYTRHYALAWHARPDAERFLMLGGGGYSVPKFLLAAKPGAQIDVVEIDPGITLAARDYFALPESPRLRVHDEDARTFLNRAAARADVRYPVIMGDTFTSSYNIPFHLTTVEAARAIHALLDEDGVFACNIISAVTGEEGRIFRGIYRSFAQVFPTLEVFPVNSRMRPDDVQNIMLLARKSTSPLPPAVGDPDLSAMLAGEWKQAIERDVPSLTDDFAPVERYAIRTLRSRR